MQNGELYTTHEAWKLDCMEPRSEEQKLAWQNRE